jgi:hypothetical protein
MLRSNEVNADQRHEGTQARSHEVPPIAFGTLVAAFVPACLALPSYRAYNFAPGITMIGLAGTTE